MMNTGLFLEILFRRRALLKRDRWNRSTLVAHQTKALQGFRNFSYRYSPFYQSFHKGLEKAPLHELPIITKSILMENYDEILTDRTVTSVVYFSGIARNDYRSSFFRASERVGGVTAKLFHRMKLAVVSSRTTYHQSARAGVTLQSWWVPTLRLDANQPSCFCLHDLYQHGSESSWVEQRNQIVIIF